MEPKKFFKNKKVLIMGLGTKGGGVDSVKFAHKHGARITITDLQNADYLKSSLLELENIPKKLMLGQHCLEDFEDHDIIIKNPGIKYENKFLQHALNHNKLIETPISLFNKFYHKNYVGITGTKGKSYTTALVTHLISALNRDIIAAGNNCVSPLLYVDEDMTFVLELSSWQLREMGIQKKSPHIACWLNFFPDHMDYYSSIDEYFADKLQITENQTENDYLIIPFGYTKLRNIQTKAHKILFSVEDLSYYKLNVNESVCYISNNIIFLKQADKISKIISQADFLIHFVTHQLQLVIASICITCIYAESNKITLSSVKQALQKQLINFKGPVYRFETIYKQDKLVIINDSAASTPESTILALQSCTIQPIVLLAGGGSHKNLSYSNLAKIIADKNVFVILYADDETSICLRKELTNIYYDKYLFIDDLSKALPQALKLLINQTGTILFSPACSGYPVFKDMFERGELFNTYVKNLLLHL